MREITITILVITGLLFASTCSAQASLSMFAAKSFAEQSEFLIHLQEDLLLLYPLVTTEGADNQLTDKDILMLSRIAISESGWTSTYDHAAIYNVLQDVKRRLQRRNKARITFKTAATRYSKYATGRLPAKTQRQMWVQSIKPSCEKPNYFPGDWRPYKEKCLAIFEKSQKILKGTLSLQCTPHHWGGDMDRERALRGKFVKVACGNTRNTFYRYPTQTELYIAKFLKK